jgi:hypothetical protein
VSDRLAAIGPYTERTESGERIICWAGLPDLRCEFPSVRLCFAMQSLSGDLEPDGRMFALWERYRPRHAEHAAWFRERVLSFYRGMTLPFAYERDEFPLDMPDAEVVRRVEGIEIRVWRQEDPAWGVQYLLGAYFDVAWEREHLSWLLYDEERDSFGDWM